MVVLVRNIDVEMDFKRLIGDIRIPVLGIGTWLLGGDRHPDFRHDNEDVASIKNAIKLGYTHIDTAELYGGGHTEELVGKAIKDVDRKTLFITSKVWETNLHYHDVIAAAKRSLDRMKTPYIDLYLVHMPNPNIPIKETMEAMDFLVEQGVVRCIGVSNFSAEQLENAQRYSKNKIAANQIEYNLLTRNRGLYTTDMERTTIPYCQANDITVIAWRPLALGQLAKPGFALLDELAGKYRKTQAQVAINWMIYKKGIVTVVKAASIEHLQENLGAVGWQLTPEDMSKLDNGI